MRSGRRIFENCDDETYDTLVENDRIVLTYNDNPNGSRADIAGIVNEAGNVFGLMPHPERALETLLGSDDGLNRRQPGGRVQSGIP